MRSLLAAALLIAAVVGIYQSAVRESGAGPDELKTEGERIAREISELDPSRP
jgi:hypothetical protein